MSSNQDKGATGGLSINADSKRDSDYLHRLDEASPKVSDQSDTVESKGKTGRSKTQITRREKEPEKFDGKSIDWKDYIVHFEKMAVWNQWNECDKAQQLSMSLRGSAQKLLGDLPPEIVNDYSNLKSTLSQRFNPKERVTACRCEFRTRTRKTYPEGEYNLFLEQLKHVQFAHPQTLQAAIACAVEYDAFTSAQFNPRKPKEVDNSPGLPIRAINTDKNELRDNSKVEETKDTKSANPDLNTLASTLNSCIKQLTEKTRRLSFKFLLDNGSDASIVDKSAFDKLGIDTSLLQTVLITLTSAEGSQMKIYGYDREGIYGIKNEEKIKFQNLILSFQDIFVGPDLVSHSIDTEKAKPVKIPPRRIPISQKQVVEKEIDRLLGADLIEPSNSPWSAPILLFTKKDGSIRFCVDNRGLSVTVKDLYPLPRIDTSLDSLGGNIWYYTVDLASGYWQCPHGA
ncbi:unnamed protein product [Mytilus coruscus]|uniref:Reverse transcriptase domain-containing protein n=1 Tax=Mytilus coruscus TaxID=42192 RepID=A0A6J8C9R2_MYTCO|nr:unnamed protein product [Mytilus coruscus]